MCIFNYRYLESWIYVVVIINDNEIKSYNEQTKTVLKVK